jgi:hypothetical protein
MLVEQGAGLERSDTDLERLQDIMEQTVEFMLGQLLERFGGNQFEAPVLRLLERIYDQAAVHKRAGRAEEGADYEINLTDPLGVASTIVVQLKAYRGDFDDYHALEQIRTAVGQYDAAAAVLVTTAARETDGIATAREALAEELGVPIHFVAGAELSRLFIAHLGELVTSDQ